MSRQTRNNRRTSKLPVERSLQSRVDKTKVARHKAKLRPSVPRTDSSSPSCDNSKLVEEFGVPPFWDDLEMYKEKPQQDES